MEESNHVKKIIYNIQYSILYHMYSLNRLTISKKCKNTEQQEEYKIYVLFH